MCIYIYILWPHQPRFSISPPVGRSVPQIRDGVKFMRTWRSQTRLCLGPFKMAARRSRGRSCSSSLPYHGVTASVKPKVEIPPFITTKETHWKYHRARFKRTKLHPFPVACQVWPPSGCAELSLLRSPAKILKGVCSYSGPGAWQCSKLPQGKLSF